MKPKQRSESKVVYIKNSFFKRTFDIILSLIGLIFFSWLWALICIVIIIEDGFPVLIKQKRIGKDGKLFDYYKFRSMAKSALSVEIHCQAKESDPRITKIGCISRNTAFDELPQLINILIGDMSFVGPRPLLPVEVEINIVRQNTDIHNIPGYEQRIKVRPGLTGIAQIYAPRDLPREKKFKYDVEYISKMNFLFDIKLIFLSFIVTLLGRWEKRGPKLSVLRKQ